MTDGDLKYLSRKELLEMLIEQEKENEHLREELRLAQEALNNRNIKVENAGSLAEAAFAVNGVYESVDDAAQQYLESIKKYEEDIKKRDEESKIKCQRIISEAMHKADAIIADAESVRMNKLRELNLYLAEAKRKK